MRIVFVWIVAITLIFMITVGWYISQPVVVGVARSLADSTSNSFALTLFTAIEYVSYIWGPLFDIFLLLWAIISSGKRDIESEIYG